MYSGTVAQKNCILLFAGVYWEAPEEKWAYYIHFDLGILVEEYTVLLLTADFL